jgi:hypothetical protein
MKKNRYTFLEWVFDEVGFGKFILILYIFLLLIAAGVLGVVALFTGK